MSKVLRNDLWMVMISWSLFLCGYRLLALVVLVSVTVYLYSNAEPENGFRAAVVFSLCAVLFSAALLILGIGFLRFSMGIVLSVNCMLLDAYLYRFDDKDLLAASIMGSVIFGVFLISSLFVGWYYVLITVLIFMPYLALMFVKAFEKEQKIPFCSYNIKA